MKLLSNLGSEQWYPCLLRIGLDEPYHRLGWNGSGMGCLIIFMTVFTGTADANPS